MNDLPTTMPIFVGTPCMPTKTSHIRKELLDGQPAQIIWQMVYAASTSYTPSDFMVRSRHATLRLVCNAEPCAPLVNDLAQNICALSADGAETFADRGAGAAARRTRYLARPFWVIVATCSVFSSQDHQLRPKNTKFVTIDPYSSVWWRFQRAARLRCDLQECRRRLRLLMMCRYIVKYVILGNKVSRIYD